MAYTFLIGGARSGKSSLAVRFVSAVANRGLAVTFVATAEGLDDEMRARIAHHQTERPASWSVREAPRDLAGVVATLPAEHCVLIDCVSMWVANLVMEGVDDVESQADEIARSLAGRVAPTFVVSNEVGLGLVPDNELGRRFRDALGRVNATFSLHAADAHLVVAGRTLALNPPPL